MKSYDYDAVTYDGAVYCAECLPDGIGEEDEEVSPIFADSEWDYYPVCTVCHTQHDYMNLTTHGRRAMRPFSDKVKKLLGGDMQKDLPKCAWPGGYSLIYFDKDNEVLCPDCANKADWSDAEIIDYDVHWEGDSLYCANCDKELESEYGPMEEEK